MTPYKSAGVSWQQAGAYRLTTGARCFLVAVATPATGQIGRGGGKSFNAACDSGGGTYLTDKELA